MKPRPFVPLEDHLEVSALAYRTGVARGLLYSGLLLVFYAWAFWPRESATVRVAAVAGGGGGGERLPVPAVARESANAPAVPLAN